MDLFTSRCACGAIVRLPSIKARSYSTRCPECLAIGRVRAEKARPERMAAVRADSEFVTAMNRETDRAVQLVECAHELCRATDRCTRCGESGYDIRRTREALKLFAPSAASKWAEAQANCSHGMFNLDARRCSDCGMTESAMLKQARRRAKTALDYALCNVNELDCQLALAHRDEPQAVRGIKECLTAAKAELAGLRDVR